MKTFIQFLNETQYFDKTVHHWGVIHPHTGDLTCGESIDEARHSAGSRVHDWGVIHPKTGSLISGQSHPTATTHHFLKASLAKKHPTINSDHYPEYVHYNQHDHGSTLQVRSQTPESHAGLQKGLKHLPTAQHYEHGSYDKHGNEVFHEFGHERQLAKHVNSLVN